MFPTRSRSSDAMNACRLSCAALLVCVVMAAGAFAQPIQYHASGLPCADGSCLPNTYNFGYYQTRWRRWPTSSPPIQTPEPTDASERPLPPPEIPEPRYEGNPSPPVRTPRETPGTTDPLPIPPDLTPPMLPPPLGLDAADEPLSPLVQRVRAWAERKDTAAIQFVPPPDEFPAVPAAHAEKTTPSATILTFPTRAKLEEVDASVQVILPAPDALPKHSIQTTPIDTSKSNQSTVVFRVHPHFQPPAANTEITP